MVSESLKVIMFQKEPMDSTLLPLIPILQLLNLLSPNNLLQFVKHLVLAQLQFARLQFARLQFVRLQLGSNKPLLDNNSFNKLLFRDSNLLLPGLPNNKLKSTHLSTLLTQLTF